MASKQGASDYLRKYGIPEGFEDLLEHFVVEVLRDQPEDMVDFGVNYFGCLNDVSFKLESI